MKKTYLLMALTVILLVLLWSCGAPESTSDQMVEEDSVSTLNIVKDRGMLVCGVTTGVPGYSAPDSSNQWKGFDVDVCRAISSAIFGDADKVEYKPLTAKERFTALQSGEIDVLSRVTTWTITRDVALGLNFAGVAFYDGQGFMVAKNSGITELSDLDGATICVQAGTTTEQNLSDYFTKNNLEYTLVTYERNEQAASALEEGRCNSSTSDQSQLYALRSKFAKPDDYIILGELISKEPLGPVVRHNDDQWFDIVKWSLLAMVNAEEDGITSANVESMKGSDNPSIKRLLGIDGDYGAELGLSNDWAYNIIKLVGNYGEIFERNLGKESPLKIDRGYNALWFNGGLQYGYPIR